MNLCKLKTPIIHSSNAASLGCYDIVGNKFNYDYNAEVLTDIEFIGQYRGIPVCIPVGDNQASVFSTLSDEDNILINIGTGSRVSVISEEYSAGENIEVRPYFGEKYLIVGAALVSMIASGYDKNSVKMLIKYDK